ncbi:unnamed protein product, partial [Mesorhabditis belari]|uniref:Uncharacterized protein n=1 Tax=Mesorhabditis belari TaxID=2138241 RepID=A0AAF3ETM7_9BILA
MHAGALPPIPAVTLLLFFTLVTQATTFFIRSFIPPDKTCNSTAGHECFALMFDRMAEVCTDREPLTFKCIHYNFLDQCFNQRVGYCTTAQITTFAQVGLDKSRKKCERIETKSYRDIIPPRASSRQFGDERLRLPATQLISTFGYLQTHCSAIQNTSCVAEAMEHIFEHCEHEIRSKISQPTASDFDRHKLLRIKLDASRRLLAFLETENHYECLMVKWNLKQIHKIHEQHCFHTIMTRCLCERAEFEKHCNVKCKDLEVAPPEITEREWEELRSRLHHGASTRHFSSLLIISFLAILVNFNF